MKKSVEEAKTQAKKLSAEHPHNTVRVLDKPRKHAVVCASDLVYRERILDGWHVVTTYRAGKSVDTLKVQHRLPEKVSCDKCTDKGHCPEYKSGASCVIDR